MGLVDETVVVDEIAIAGVVRRIDIDAADAVVFVFVAHAQRAQGIVVVAFDDEVAPRRVAMAERGVEIQCHEVVVERVVGFQLSTGMHVALPHQPQLALGVAALQ